MNDHADISYKVEGDINLSSERIRWQQEHLSEMTRQTLVHDSEVYFHQSLSTPCLNAISHAEGIYIYDMDGRKYMDFHGK